jgi:uncharacterized protein with HEPN domain
MSTRDPQSFLHDVLSAIANIETFTLGKTFENYLADDMLRSAVERQLMIIGEAIAQLSKVDRSVAERLLDSPQIIAFRNRLIHDYGQVDHAMVWGVVSSRLGALKARLQELLSKGQS